MVSSIQSVISQSSLFLLCYLVFTPSLHFCFNRQDDIRMPKTFTIFLIELFNILIESASKVLTSYLRWKTPTYYYSIIQHTCNLLCGNFFPFVKFNLGSFLFVSKAYHMFYTVTFWTLFKDQLKEKQHCWVYWFAK